MHASVVSLDAAAAAGLRPAKVCGTGSGDGEEDAGVQLEPGSIEHVAHPEALPHGPWGRRLYAASRVSALMGGTVFMLMIGMSLVSIVGRKLFALPVPGDFEVLQMGAAVASATFFSYCQMVDGHVRVDFFTHWLPLRVRALLDGVAALLMGAVALLVAWRTGAAAVSSYDSGEASVMLGWPGWVAIALIVPGFLLFTATSLYIAGRRFGVVLGGAK
ncbi:TRAP transporter small permease subunit [Aromatoleum toluvorans]|uniref:TRAP transporter small permease protein n=1 Tax=Aromatoleum toluvorans TaxID=92002 RepID=A0ABX1Q2Q5_9RHOO|nr:TRAP transporter small permease [Aromatoleum toluvorans]NMG45653.1 TRAP transporter small permease subunit [Aromatoleum toluvorans]